MHRNDQIWRSNNSGNTEEKADHELDDSTMSTFRTELGECTSTVNTVDELTV